MPLITSELFWNPTQLIKRTSSSDSTCSSAISLRLWMQEIDTNIYVPNQRYSATSRRERLGRDKLTLLHFLALQLVIVLGWENRIPRTDIFLPSWQPVLLSLLTDRIKPNAVRITGTKMIIHVWSYSHWNKGILCQDAQIDRSAFTRLRGWTHNNSTTKYLNQALSMAVRGAVK